jgi:hypothetical protein
MHKVDYDSHRANENLCRRWRFLVTSKCLFINRSVKYLSFWRGTCPFEVVENQIIELGVGNLSDPEYQLRSLQVCNWLEMLVGILAMQHLGVFLTTSYLRKQFDEVFPDWLIPCLKQPTLVGLVLLHSGMRVLWPGQPLGLRREDHSVATMSNTI